MDLWVLAQGFELRIERAVCPSGRAKAASQGAAQANPQLAVRLDDLVQSDLRVALWLGPLLSGEKVLDPPFDLLEVGQAG